MLAYLFESLARESARFNVFRYITFRGICGALTALTVCLVVDAPDRDRAPLGCGQQ